MRWVRERVRKETISSESRQFVTCARITTWIGELGWNGFSIPQTIGVIWMNSLLATTQVYTD